MLSLKHRPFFFLVILEIESRSASSEFAAPYETIRSSDKPSFVAVFNPIHSSLERIIKVLAVEYWRPTSAAIVGEPLDWPSAILKSKNNNIDRHSPVPLSSHATGLLFSPSPLLPFPGLKPLPFPRGPAHPSYSYTLSSSLLLFLSFCRKARPSILRVRARDTLLSAPQSTWHNSTLWM